MLHGWTLLSLGLGVIPKQDLWRGEEGSPASEMLSTWLTFILGPEQDRQ